jgi:putative transposase
MNSGVSSFSLTRVCLKADTPEDEHEFNMQKKTKFKRHKPFHLYLDDKIYFVTCSTLDKEKHFDTDGKKEIIKKRLKTGAVKFQVRIYAWVILSNHYHFLFQFKEKQNLGKFLAFINGGSSFDLNSLENRRGRQVWWNYWDNCIRNEETFYRRFNYIHHNPVKHGYVKKCEDYEFSSYNYYLKKYGEDYMGSIFARYPIIDFTDKSDKF